MARDLVSLSLGTLLACAAFRPGAAGATPFVDVGVFATVSAPRAAGGSATPAGIVFLCDGVAASACGISLQAVSGPAADYSYAASQTRTVTIENMTGTVQGNLFTLNDAAAGYGYPGRGAGVDDPTVQSASFSAVTDSSLRFAGLYDQRACATAAASPVCSTQPWDSTGSYDYALAPLDPGQSLTFTISASLRAVMRDPTAVPEPAAAALVGAGLAGLAALRRRRAVARRRGGERDGGREGGARPPAALS